MSFGHGKDVLVVDDEALIRLEMVEALRDAGYAVLDAENADDAIALLERNPAIGLVVTDVQMPGTMDGVRLCQYIRNKWPPVKLMVVSSMALDPLAKLPSDVRFLSKPIAPEQLISSLRDLAASPSPWVHG